MALHITALFAALLAFWHLFLTFRVIGFRRTKGVSLGHGDSEIGERLIRAQGNAAETIPIFLILMGLSESMGGAAALLYALGAVFLVARVVHGLHFQKIRKGFRMRFFGMLFTLIAITVMAGKTLVLAVMSH